MILGSSSVSPVLLAKISTAADDVGDAEPIPDEVLVPVERRLDHRRPGLQTLRPSLCAVRIVLANSTPKVAPLLLIGG